MSVPTLESARELVLRYGWNTTAYQILNPGMRHWFAPAGAPGVVGFAARAFCQGSPTLALGHALARALRQELVWLVERFTDARQPAPPCL